MRVRALVERGHVGLHLYWRGRFAAGVCVMLRGRWAPGPVDFPARHIGLYWRGRLREHWSRR